MGQNQTDGFAEVDFDHGTRNTKIEDQLARCVDREQGLRGTSRHELDGTSQKTK